MWMPRLPWRVSETEPGTTSGATTVASGGSLQAPADSASHTIAGRKAPARRTCTSRPFMAAAAGSARSRRIERSALRQSRDDSGATPGPSWRRAHAADLDGERPGADRVGIAVGDAGSDGGGAGAGAGEQRL